MLYVSGAVRIDATAARFGSGRTPNNASRNGRWAGRALLIHCCLQCRQTPPHLREGRKAESWARPFGRRAGPGLAPPPVQRQAGAKQMGRISAQPPNRPMIGVEDREVCPSACGRCRNGGGCRVPIDAGRGGLPVRTAAGGVRFLRPRLPSVACPGARAGIWRAREWTRTAALRGLDRPRREDGRGCRSGSDVLSLACPAIRSWAGAGETIRGRTRCGST